MVFASGSMVVAAIVEISRKNVMRDGGYLLQNIAGDFYNSSDVSVFAQIPQYALIGASEVFTSITGKRSLKAHCTTCSYLLPLYNKQYLIGDHWSPMILFFLC